MKVNFTMLFHSTGEEFNKYKKIVFATAKALRKAQGNEFL